MKKLIIGLTLAMLLTLAAVVPASAAPPCNDTDGDGSPSGREYAEHHIVPLGTEGNLGAAPSGHAHTPGAHQGFSACDPSG